MYTCYVSVKVWWFCCCVRTKFACQSQALMLDSNVTSQSFNSRGNIMAFQTLQFFNHVLLLNGKILKHDWECSGRCIVLVHYGSAPLRGSPANQQKDRDNVWRKHLVQTMPCVPHMAETIFIRDSVNYENQFGFDKFFSSSENMKFNFNANNSFVWMYKYTLSMTFMKIAPYRVSLYKPQNKHNIDWINSNYFPLDPCCIKCMTPHHL